MLKMKNYVFVGDSVTDSDRKRSKKYAHTEAALGNGWVKVLAQSALKDHRVWNRGFSGYKVADTLVDADSWPESVEKADITTLMIGINDIWHTFKHNAAYKEPEIMKCFESLVGSLKSRSTKLVVMEPVWLLVGEVDERWLPKMASLFTSFERVCERQSVQWLSLQESLHEAAKDQPEGYLFDGVHPSDKGHRWLAKQWLAKVPTT